LGMPGPRVPLHGRLPSFHSMPVARRCRLLRDHRRRLRRRVGLSRHLPAARLDLRARAVCWLSRRVHEAHLRGPRPPPFLRRHRRWVRRHAEMRDPVPVPILLCGRSLCSRRRLRSFGELQDRRSDLLWADRRCVHRHARLFDRLPRGWVDLPGQHLRRRAILSRDHLRPARRSLLRLDRRRLRRHPLLWRMSGRQYVRIRPLPSHKLRRWVPARERTLAALAPGTSPALVAISQSSAHTAPLATAALPMPGRTRHTHNSCPAAELPRSALVSQPLDSPLGIGNR
jgi:hypothetical protein